MKTTIMYWVKFDLPLYVRYHPKVNNISIENEEGYDPHGHSPSFCCWIVPGTVDPNED